jgi:subtilisin family serine protease
VSPARAAGTLTVGAVDPRTDRKPSFSNFGPCVDIFAPGVAILSAGIASNNATAILSGTSMATPHVSGVVAVLLSENPTLNPDQVRQLITLSATKNAIPNLNSGDGSPNALLFFPSEAADNLTGGPTVRSFSSCSPFS